MRCVRFVLVLFLIVGFGSPALTRADVVTPNDRVNEFVTVRAAARASAAERGQLKVGEHAELIRSQPRWFRVRLANGTEGFVLKAFTTVAAAAPQPTPGVQPVAAAWLTNVPAVSQGSREMNVHVIDVGQGAATLYEFPCGAILIDTGSEENVEFAGGPKLTAYLDRFFASRPDLGNRLDLLLLTHAHVDHTHNAQTVIERFKPKHLVDNGLRVGSGKKGQIFLQTWKDTHGVPYEAVKIEDVTSGAGISDGTIDPLSCSPRDPVIRVLFGGLRQAHHCLPGWTETNCTNGNNSSVVVRIDFGDFSILNTGDLEEAGIDELRSRSESLGLLDVDLYHVGHHGSRNGTTEEFVAAMSPKIAVISMGDSARQVPWSAWAYGHPNRQALNHLVAADGVSGTRPSVRVPVGLKGGTSPEWTEWTMTKAVYGTGWDGTIVVHANDQGQFNVFTEHGH